MQIISKQNIEYLLKGATLFGCGGGGSYKLAKDILKNIKLGKIKILEKEDIKNNARYSTAYLVGNLKSKIKKIRFADAWKKYSDFFGKSEGLIIGEVGAGVIAGNILLAKLSNIPLLDTDAGGGRCIPLISTEIFEIYNGLTRLPLMVCSNNGNCRVINSAKNSEEIEQQIQHVLKEDGEGGTLYVVGYTNKGVMIKKYLYWGSLTKTIEVGKSLVKNKEIDDFNVIHTGKISKVSLVSGKRLTIGQIEIDKKYTIVVKNENIVLKRGNDIVTKAPDIITLLDEKSKVGLINSEIRKGQTVKILTSKAPEEWKNSYYLFEKL